MQIYTYTHSTFNQSKGRSWYFAFHSPPFPKSHSPSFPKVVQMCPPARFLYMCMCVWGVGGVGEGRGKGEESAIFQSHLSFVQCYGAATFCGPLKSLRFVAPLNLCIV